MISNAWDSSSVFMISFRTEVDIMARHQLLNNNNNSERDREFSTSRSGRAERGTYGRRTRLGQWREHRQQPHVRLRRRDRRPSQTRSTWFDHTWFNHSIIQTQSTWFDHTWFDHSDPKYVIRSYFQGMRMNAFCVGRQAKSFLKKYIWYRSETIEGFGLWELLKSELTHLLTQLKF